MTNSISSSSSGRSTGNFSHSNFLSPLLFWFWYNFNKSMHVFINKYTQVTLRQWERDLWLNKIKSSALIVNQADWVWICWEDKCRIVTFHSLTRRHLMQFCALAPSLAFPRDLLFWAAFRFSPKHNREAASSFDIYFSKETTSKFSKAILSWASISNCSADKAFWASNNTVLSSLGRHRLLPRPSIWNHSVVS